MSEVLLYGDMLRTDLSTFDRIPVDHSLESHCVAQPSCENMFVYGDLYWVIIHYKFTKCIIKCTHMSINEWSETKWMQCSKCIGKRPEKGGRVVTEFPFVGRGHFRGDKGPKNNFFLCHYGIALGLQQKILELPPFRR